MTHSEIQIADLSIQAQVAVQGGLMNPLGEVLNRGREAARRDLDVKGGLVSPTGTVFTRWVTGPEGA